MQLIQRNLNRVILHHLQPSIDANNTSHTFFFGMYVRVCIVGLFKGQRHHHIESARAALNSFKFAIDVEKDRFTLKDLISNLEKAKGPMLVLLT